MKDFCIVVLSIAVVVLALCIGNVKRDLRNLNDRVERLEESR